MKNTFRGCLVGVMALLSLTGNAYGWSREEEKKLEDLQLIVWGLRKVNERTRRDEASRWHLEGYQVSVETRLKALRQISRPCFLAHCAFMEVTGRNKEGDIVIGRRKADDPVRKEAMRMLMAMPMGKVIEDLRFRDGGFNYVAKIPRFNQHVDIAFDRYTFDEQMFVMCCEEFSKNQKVLFDFLKESRRYWHDCKMQKQRKAFEQTLCECLTEECQEMLVAFFKDYHDYFEDCFCRSVRNPDDDKDFEKKSMLLERVYELMSNDNKLVTARFAVTCEKHNFDWAFEAKMIKDHLKVFIKEFGAESGVKLPRDAAINRLSFLLRDDEGREPFEGIFGRKFGETIAVDEKCRVRSFGMNFYRVRFEPEKKSQAFADYYLWVSEVTRKVFAIEARSKSALSDVLVTALEKKYKTRFANSGQYYEMLFPKEACSFKMFKNISYSSSSDGYGAGLFAAMIFNSDFGNSILRQTGDEIEKRKRSVKNYIFTQADRQSGGVAVAESVELFAMAKRESQIAETEREKEAQLRKKLEADNAADAF